mmetsp:Transcript_53792/g.107053  ORF Transcript_53792/g.107053 Transcript_53792/m.107053 type:complete len:216 (+) Transcript_53792:585-1232(+)
MPRRSLGSKARSFRRLRLIQVLQASMTKWDGGWTKRFALRSTCMSLLGNGTKLPVISRGWSWQILCLPCMLLAMSSGESPQLCGAPWVSSPTLLVWIVHVSFRLRVSAALIALRWAMRRALAAHCSTKPLLGAVAITATRPPTKLQDSASCCRGCGLDWTRVTRPSESSTPLAVSHLAASCPSRLQMSMQQQQRFQQGTWSVSSQTLSPSHCPRQ